LGDLTSFLGTVTCCKILNFESYQNFGENILGPLKLTCAFVFTPKDNKNWRKGILPGGWRPPPGPPAVLPDDDGHRLICSWQVLDKQTNKNNFLHILYLQAVLVRLNLSIRAHKRPDNCMLSSSLAEFRVL